MPQQRMQLRRRIGFVYQDDTLVERSGVFSNVISGWVGHFIQDQASAEATDRALLEEVAQTPAELETL